MNTETKPTVTIIVPVYNAEKYLDVCLNSLISQSFKNLEIILVNDGSTDRSKSICDLYAKKDLRIKVIHKNNEGVVQARISGFLHSTGSYIAFVDSDDFIDNTYVEHLLNNAIYYQVDMVGCQYYYVDNGKMKRAKSRPDKGFYDKRRIVNLLKTDFLYNNNTKSAGMNIFLWAKLIKRQFVVDLLNAGRGLWYQEDLVGTLWLLYTINSMYISPEYLYFYVLHDGQTIKTFKPQILDNIENCLKSIAKIDTEYYLLQQIPFRTFLEITRVLGQCFSKTYNFPNFKSFFEKVCHSNVTCVCCKTMLQKAYFSKLTIKEKIQLLLLRKHFVMAYYFCLMISGIKSRIF